VSRAVASDCVARNPAVYLLFRDSVADAGTAAAHCKPLKSSCYKKDAPHENDFSAADIEHRTRQSVQASEESCHNLGGYVVAQIVGALAGVALADTMFGEPVYAWSQHARSGFPQIVSEAVATFGLLSVIWGCARRRPEAVAFAVGAYITAAYWFTASTSFANPAVTLARALTNTFAGIRPGDVPGFLLGQTVGAAAATVLFRWLVPALPAVSDRVVVPHDRQRSEAKRRG